MSDLDLTNLTDAQLRAELERRAAARFIAPLSAKNFTKLVQLCQDDVKQTMAGERDEDMEQYIYEAALEAVYGKTIWNALREEAARLAVKRDADATGIIGPRCLSPLTDWRHKETDMNPTNKAIDLLEEAVKLLREPGDSTADPVKRRPSIVRLEEVIADLKRLAPGYASVPSVPPVPSEPAVAPEEYELPDEFQKPLDKPAGKE